jgi:Zn-dependent protease with chaperone function
MPEDHLELFKVLRDISSRVGQSMPKEVYLVHDMNAWVMERGGLMGIGSRRVMGLGLPLLGSLTVAQLRAVLVHEFGHFDGGDTKLGPWVYKTRSAIIRTVVSLEEHSRLLKAVFNGYARLFLRVSHAVSRGQEFAADRLAAVTVGAQPLIDGLTTIHRVAPAQEAYWANEVAPVLQAGYLPDVDAGFQKFLGARNVQESLERIEEARENEQGDPYDTHPPLRARVEAVRNLEADTSEPSDDRPATALLSPDFDATASLLRAMAGPEFMESVKRIRWEEVGLKVHAPQWRAAAAQIAPQLKDVRFSGLIKTVLDAEGLAERFVEATASQLTEEQGMQISGHVIGVATAVALLDRGGVLRSEFGEPEVITIEDFEIRPFMLAQELASGEIKPERWALICDRLGILGVALGDIQAEPTVETGSCARCGTNLEVGAQFCTSCGDPV